MSSTNEEPSVVWEPTTVTISDFDFVSHKDLTVDFKVVADSHLCTGHGTAVSGTPPYDLSIFGGTLVLYTDWANIVNKQLDFHALNTTLTDEMTITFHDDTKKVLVMLHSHYSLRNTQDATGKCEFHRQELDSGPA